jgi:hypothetical protein
MFEKIKGEPVASHHEARKYYVPVSSKALNQHISNNDKLEC